MKTIKTISILGIAMVIFFSSCSVEKRRYRKGYNVDKSKKKEKAEVKEDNTPPAPNSADIMTISPATAVIVNIPVDSTYPKDTTTTPPTKINANSGEYTFQVVVGPRPDKAGKRKKKYPMNMH